ncbi:MAG: FimB/Mfa2 family fimbrial subunit, partial [Muribaculaceae bacterium]|nr:FimB/Mfa2 family fimbrial subunit [Muribaculaceae bacterium]
MKILNKLTQSCVVVASLATATLGLGSCGDALHEHLEPCPSGVTLRFVFDYNMEFANAFPSQVDCLTLLVYDASGHYVTSVSETSEVLADENWRMTIDLPAGEYSFIAYGGLECRESSFHFVTTPSEGSLLTDLEVEMDARCINANPGVDLHPLFYGSLDLSLPKEALTYTEATLYMMRDTHELRILLQNVNGRPVNVDDYTFSITADNTLFNWENELLPTAQGITYSPW